MYSYFYLDSLCFLGQVWSWGDGDYGKLGRGGSDGCKTPKLIEKLQDLDLNPKSLFLTTLLQHCLFFTRKTL